MPVCIYFCPHQLAKYKDEQIATMRAAADMTAQAQIIMIIVPSARVVIDVNCTVWFPFSALIERHLGSIKEQAESEQGKSRLKDLPVKGA